MAKHKLRAVTFLAPNMRAVYRFTMEYVGNKLDCDIELVTGTKYEEIYVADLSFICGLPYILRTPPRVDPPPIDAIAAPVLQGERYQGKPVYYSDVIVHRDSPFQSFADLRGCSWAYNEPESQSGYGITRYWLAKMGETAGYFSWVIEAGYHQEAIRMVCAREVDAAAIDSQVLAVELRDHARLANKLRVIDSLGPSTIQPLAAARHLPASLKYEIQSVLAEMHHDENARANLDRGFVDRFVAVQDSDYDDIRVMLEVCEQANFLVLR
jgi:phosphonate transport system substrate-binding protein